MVSLRFREFLTGYIAEEFDSLVAQLRSFFSVSFNEDGTLVGVDTSLSTVRIGTVTDFAGPTPPTGWLECNGGAVSRVTYKSLFEVIATTWGAGDGSTTFNLPDFRGRFRLGKAASGTGSGLGQTGGSLDHTHSGGAHTHSISGVSDHSHGINSESDHTHSTGAHSHAVNSGSPLLGDITGGGLPVYPATSTPILNDAGTSADGGHDHGGTTGNAGTHDHGGATGSASGTTGSANPPFGVVLTIIFAGV